MGYMEISDLDEQTHLPPTEDWVLVAVDYNILNSSQIFRYFPAQVMAELGTEPAGVEK